MKEKLVQRWNDAKATVFLVITNCLKTFFLENLNITTAL